MNSFLISPIFVHQLLEIVIALLIAIIANLLCRVFIKFPKKFETRSSKRYTAIIRNIVTIIIAILFLHIVFLILGQNVTPLLASIGVIGVITAIVVNSVFGDLVGGFFLLWQSTITIGDYINIGSNIAGTIIGMGIKNMTLLGDDGVLIIVPNGQIKTIINYSNTKINNFIDMPVIMNQSIDETLALFTTVLNDLKKDSTLIIYDESTIIGIKNVDAAANVVTITTKIVTPSALRGTIDHEYRYRILKMFERKKSKGGDNHG